jgi:hypothetical protein
MRRFTRLTNTFSKKLENLTAAVRAGRVHTTPAMATGADHVWSLIEMAALLDSK